MKIVVREEVFLIFLNKKGRYLAKIVYLDCITLNEYRHLANIGLIKEKGVYREAPVYDNGLSLLSDISKYSMNVKYSRYLNDVRSRPFHTNFSIQRSFLVVNL